MKHRHAPGAIVEIRGRRAQVQAQVPAVGHADLADPIYRISLTDPDFSTDGFGCCIRVRESELVAISQEARP